MKRLFLTEIDTPLGRRVTERFGLTKEFTIVGTSRSQAGTLVKDFEHRGDDEDAAADPAGAQVTQHALPFVSQVVPSYLQDPAAFKQRILEADVIICPLTDSNLEAEAAIKMLANTAFEVEKTFILVSSMLTWANTFAAQRAEEHAEKVRERLAAIEAGEEAPPEVEEEPEPTDEEKPTFGDDGYQKRVPHPRYQHWRDLEHFVKASNSETLHTHVIFSGLPYGREAPGILHDLFRSAWHGQALPMFTAGNNVVPMIHIDDLANIVFKIGNSNDVVPQRYLVGVDRGNCTLGAVIKAINDHLGSGKTVLVPPSQLAVVPQSEWLTVDLKTEPGAVFELVEESEWVAPDGFVAAAEKIVLEYERARHVTPLRTAVLGPPLSGKSTISRWIATEYRVAHLEVSSVISAYEANVDKLRLDLHRARAARRLAKRRLAEEEAKKAREEAGEALAAPDEGVPAGGKADADGEGGEPGEGKENDDDGSPRAHQVSSKDIADDVSDIEYDDDAIPPTPAGTNSNGPTPAGGDDLGADDTGGGGGASVLDAADPDEDEDEQIAKLKEDIATGEKVLRLRRREKISFGAVKLSREEMDASLEGGGADGGGGDGAGLLGQDGDGGGDIPEQQADGGTTEALDAFTRLRYIDEALAVMYRWRLSRKDCRNQGYVLDGFPKTVRQGMLTFSASDVTLPEPEDLASGSGGDGDEGSGNSSGGGEAGGTVVAEEGALNPVDEKLFPEFVLLLSAKEGLIRSRAVEETGKNIAVECPSHVSVANTMRRLAEWKLHNPTSGARPNISVQTWFSTLLTAVEPPAVGRAASVFAADAALFLADDNNVQSVDAQNSIRSFLGSPHFYRPTPEERVEREKTAARLREAAVREAAEAAVAAQREEERRQEAARQASEKHHRRFASVQKEQREASLVRALPMQQYLMEMVVPVLTDAIAKTAQQRPVDPIDDLANRLFEYKARLHV